MADAQPPVISGQEQGQSAFSVSTGWLVSARYDLVFFIGSCVVTWVFLGLYHLLSSVGLAPRAESVLLTYFVFTALFDHPHIFQTFSRTHLDKVEYQRHRRTHTWGLGFFILAGFVIVAAGYQGELIVFSAMFGSFHIMRQHWGIISAYRARNKDHNPLDRRLDFAVFYVGAVALYFHDYIENPPTTLIYGELTAPFPSISPMFGEGALYLFIAIGIGYGVRQVQLLFSGRPVNLPKLLLITAALTTHGLIFFATATPFLVAEALETTYHNVQYQGWMGHYQRKRFAIAGIARRWFKLALLYGLIVGVIEVVSLQFPSVSWLFIPFGMIVIWHYWVDGLIWKMRNQRELAVVVGGKPAPANSA